MPEKNNENGKWIIEIPERYWRRVTRVRGLNQRCFRKHGYYYTTLLAHTDARVLKRKLHKHHIFCRAYPSQYARSENYRQNFIQHNPPDARGYYKCAYCGKKIRPREMEVDHVIPVAKARKSRKYQKKLPYGVNDLSNLVPSCRRCNRRKGASTSAVWAFRHWLMKHPWGRPIRLCAIMCLYGLFMICIILAFLHPETIAALFGSLVS